MRKIVSSLSNSIKDTSTIMHNPSLYIIQAKGLRMIVLGYSHIVILYCSQGTYYLIISMLLIFTHAHAIIYDNTSQGLAPRVMHFIFTDVQSTMAKFDAAMAKLKTLERGYHATQRKRIMCKLVGVVTY